MDGRILKGILHINFGKWRAKKYINDISMVICIILTAIASIAILYIQNIAVLLIIIYLWAIVLKERLLYKKELIIYNILKSIENNQN